MIKTWLDINKTKLLLYLRPGKYGIEKIKLCFTQSQTTGTVSSIDIHEFSWFTIHSCTVPCAVGMQWLQKKQQKAQIYQSGMHTWPYDFATSASVLSNFVSSWYLKKNDLGFHFFIDRQM